MKDASQYQTKAILKPYARNSKIN